MRVNGLTKPKGAMKVKGERPGVLVAPAALSGADPRPTDAAAVIPYQSGATEGGAMRRDETLSPAPPPVPWVTRGALDGPRLPRLHAGGRRPGTCHATPSRESVVGLIGSAWALGWWAACLWAGSVGSGGFGLSPAGLVRRGSALRSCSVRSGLARVLSASTKSRHVGTRKMVNYAWPG